nr:hypothetical protein [Tanacetum cinerariifolium]
MVAILEKTKHTTDFHQIVDFLEASNIRYALTVRPTVYVSHIRQFWSTTRVKTIVGQTKILDKVNGRQRTISKSLIRRHLKLNDEEGISTLPDNDLFENLLLMGYNILPNQRIQQKIAAKGDGKKKTASRADKPKKPVSFKKSKPAPAQKPGFDTNYRILDIITQSNVIRGWSRVPPFQYQLTRSEKVDRNECISGISHWGRKRQQFYGFAINRESARDVYSKHRIIVVIELKIVEWHNYKHLDWITVQRDNDKLYKFKKGDFKRLRIQYIEDMLLLLVQGKLTNLTVEEHFSFNVSLRMFTRSIVIQSRMEDLQLGVESYQKKLNLTKPDTYRSDLKRKEAYIADGMLIDVRTTLDDRLKGIQMKYLPQSIWRKSDKDRASAMIQAINKRLKTMRIIKSLKMFIGGRLYEGDFKMLQRTI